MNVGFIMYPWEEINVKEDSSLRMIHEAKLRGHTVGIIYHNSLTIRETIVYANVQIIRPLDKTPTNTERFYKKVELKQKMIALRAFDVIFLRSNPPIDTTMLNFLDSIKNDVFIVNDVEGMRKANNKVYPATLDDPNHKYIPITHVSKSKEYLKTVIKEDASDKMILKPLDGFGGSGVIILEKNAKKNINSLLDFYIDRDGKSNYVILQEYVEGAENGDVRVIMVNGEPVGCMRRVPAHDDARSNVSAGGSVVKHTLTKTEKELCKMIGPKLVADGLYFVGLDLIGGKLIEVNVCSPGGLPWINKGIRISIQARIMDFVEGVIGAKEAKLTQRQQFRKSIQDA